MPNVSTNAVLFDLDGVLEFDGKPIWPVIEIVIRLQQRATPIAIVTNDIRWQVYERIGELQAYGVQIERRNFITPYDALREYGRRNKVKGIRYFGDRPPPEFEATLGEVGVFDTIVLGDVSACAPRLAECALLSRPGIRLLALQKNSFVPTQAPFVPDVGYHIAGWEHCLGRRSCIIGKPGSWIYRAALRSLGLKRGAGILVSDNVSTDIRGARKFGLKTVFFAQYATDFERVIGSTLESTALDAEALRSLIVPVSESFI